MTEQEKLIERLKVSASKAPTKFAREAIKSKILALENNKPVYK